MTIDVVKLAGEMVEASAGRERAVEDAWAATMRTSFPYAAGDPAIARELRHAFFCGAQHAYAAVLMIIMMTDGGAERRSSLLRKLDSELEMHAEDVSDDA